MSATHGPHALPCRTPPVGAPPTVPMLAVGKPMLAVGVGSASASALGGRHGQKPSAKLGRMPDARSSRCGRCIQSNSNTTGIGRRRC
eukprot:scaffold17472_cov105-Isochrysis_galbana.AAC.5